MTNIENVWLRISHFEGHEFKQIRGAAFSYRVVGNSLKLDRTNRSVSKGQFEKALSLVPLENTVPLQKLQAPSYIYSILMDERIRQQEW